MSVFACTLYVNQRGKGAVIIAAPPQPPPSVQSQEVFLSDPCGRACRRKKEAHTHTHTPQTRGRGAGKSSTVDRGTVSVQLGTRSFKKQQKKGRVRKEEKRREESVRGGFWSGSRKLKAASRSGFYGRRYSTNGRRRRRGE